MSHHKPAFALRSSFAHTRRSLRGQAMVEFTIVLPVLLLLLFSIIDFALAIHTQIDYGNALSTGLRQVTLVNYATNSAMLYDDPVGQSLFQSMRSDDPDRANYYSIQLRESRIITDATTNTYKNTYVYDRSARAFVVDSYVYISQHGGSPTPCQYFYEAHTSGGVAYLDRSEVVTIGEAVATQHLASALALSPSLDGANDLAHGCGRATNANTCAGNGQPVGPGHLCYYYPEERTNTIDPSGSGSNSLPDLLEVNLNYTFRPLGDYVSSHTALGYGFTITEHARARIEPVSTSQ